MLGFDEEKVIEKCPECKSKNIVAHTSDELRRKQELIYQCFDCNHFWEVKYRVVYEEEEI